MKWIDIKKRLPEPGDTVLTFPHFKVLPYGNSEKDGLSHNWSDFDFWTYQDGIAVRVRPYPTHWMPLPKAPK